MQHFFKYKGKGLLLDTSEILRLIQKSLSGNGQFSSGEQKQLAHLLEPMIYKVTRAVMMDLEKPDSPAGKNQQVIDEQYDQIIFQKSVGGEGLQEVMDGLRDDQYIDMAKLLPGSESGYISYQLSGPIHVLYDQTELVRVRAVLLAEKKLKKTLIEVKEEEKEKALPPHLSRGEAPEY